jgi:hypothetical protein
MSADIVNQVIAQTQAELDAIANAQKADRDASDAKIAVKIALLQKIGLTADEAAQLLN